jgi:glycosyltransferase involved in cell wall biosynthesis
MAKEPIVSIIMAAHNEEHFLPATLDSLLAQTFDDFELLCMDDGSTDATSDILKKYGKIDPRIRLFHHKKPQGLTASLNVLLKAARGKYIARADADDLYPPLRLEKQVTFLDAHPKVVLLSTQRTDIDEAGRPLPIQKNSPLSDTAMRWRMLFDSPCLHPVVMWRASTNMTYDEKYHVAQDYELWSRMSKLGEMAALPERLLLRRVHHGSVSAKRKEEQQATRDAISLKCLRENVDGNLSTAAQIHRWRESFMRQVTRPNKRDLIDYFHLLARFCTQRMDGKDLWRQECYKQAKAFLRYRAWSLVVTLVYLYFRCAGMGGSAEA